MTVFDFYSYIDSFAPFSTQEEWDNSGLLIGSMSQEINSVYVCLDVTTEALNKAVSLGCKLIISHHPIIFSPLKTVDGNSVVAGIIKNGISVISAHTNLDIAVGGVNDVLCERLLLKYEKSSDCNFLNFCRCTLDFLNAQAFASYCASCLNTQATICCPNNELGLIAVCSGAGASFLTQAAEHGANILVTGETKYHEYIEAQTLGISVISLGHYETEYPIVPVLKEKLSRAFPQAAIIAEEFRREIFMVK